MRRIIFSLFCLVGTLILLTDLSSNAYAGLLLEQTRIIWNGDSTQESITLKNDSDSVYLVQSGVFDTPIGQKESGVFLVTPPLYRLNPNSQQAMKILPEEKITQLPKDKESLFYFSVIGIPGVTTNNNEEQVAKLSIGTRLVIKLFYRPNGLTQSSEDAIKGLQFYLHKKNVCIENPSPYHITLSSLKINNKQYPKISGVITPPKSRYLINNTDEVNQSSKIVWKAVNDYGGDSEDNTASLILGERKTCQ